MHMVWHDYEIEQPVIHSVRMKHRLLDDPSLYNKLVSVIGSTDSLVMSINSSKGTAGLLLRDTTLYRNMVGITMGADSLMRTLNNPHGTVGKLIVVAKRTGSAPASHEAAHPTPHPLVCR